MWGGIGRGLILQCRHFTGLYLDLKGVGFHACSVSLAASVVATTKKTNSARTAAGSQVGRPDTLHCCLTARTTKCNFNAPR